MHPARAGFRRQLVVLFYLVALLALGVRTLALEDARFGWGMFLHDVRYEVRYRWLMDDGGERAYSTRKPPAPALELRDRARLVDDRKPHSTRYGIGAVRSWVAAYVKDVYESGRPDGAAAFAATVSYSINRSEERRVTTLTYPRLREEHDRGGE